MWNGVAGGTTRARRRYCQHVVFYVIDHGLGKEWKGYDREYGRISGEDGVAVNSNNLCTVEVMVYIVQPT